MISLSLVKFKVIKLYEYIFKKFYQIQQIIHIFIILLYFLVIKIE